MSTVAYKDGKIVADTQTVKDGIIQERSKLFKHRGICIGVVGILQCGILFDEWYSTGRGTSTTPKFDDDEFEAIVCDGTNVTHWGSRLVPLDITTRAYAIGSGNHIAMGAMAAGATVEEAVLIASKLDLHTNDKIEKFICPSYGQYTETEGDT